MNSTKKNRRKNASTGGGFGLPTMLLILFLILQVAEVIDWKWLWLLSPIWITASLCALFFMIIGMILLAVIVGLVKESSKVNVGIKNMFKKKIQDDKIDEEATSDD